MLVIQIGATLYRIQNKFENDEKQFHAKNKVRVKNKKMWPKFN